MTTEQTENRHPPGRAAQTSDLRLKPRWLALGIFLGAAAGSLAQGVLFVVCSIAGKHLFGFVYVGDVKGLVSLAAFFTIFGLAPWGAVTLIVGTPAAPLLHRAGWRGAAALPLAALVSAIPLAALLTWAEGGSETMTLLSVSAVAAAPVAGAVLREMIYGDWAQGRRPLPDASVFE
ncbi:hypothetical protein ACQ5SO_19920 [Rhodovulum sp. DZ06]|uniref:hypothetical protein n=1 Tax=Rhodovulum sp. DZ06 TaxID=3425126 RepID=UPI003D3277DE